MTWLVLDVDGVLLDDERDGDGHWTTELQRRFGIERSQLRRAFFEPYWEAIVTGRRPIEPALAQALAVIGTPATVDDVLACWFSADFVPVPAVVDVARRAAAAGVGVAAGTNQERRRAEHLGAQLGTLFPLSRMIASADVGHRKPEPEFFGAADARLGRDDATPVVFADDGDENVDAARRHGWTAVHARTDVNWIAEVEALLGLDSDG
jgi:putative hydrolase of the HAD superfamily